MHHGLEDGVLGLALLEVDHRRSPRFIPRCQPPPDASSWGPDSPSPPFVFKPMMSYSGTAKRHGLGLRRTALDSHDAWLRQSDIKFSAVLHQILRRVASCPRATMQAKKV